MSRDASGKADPSLSRLLRAFQESVARGASPQEAREELRSRDPAWAAHLDNENSFCRLLDEAFKNPSSSALAGETPLTVDDPSTPQERTGPWADGAAAGVKRLPVAPAGYEILSELGRGGMGVVYKARQIKLNREVALKMILAGGHAGEQELARFQIEAQAVARLQHPGIVQIHQVGEHDGRPFFSLEFVAGGSLADKLKGTPWLFSRSTEVVEHLARALQHAHEHGVIHRDMKPANVLMAADGTPKVTDFGLAKQLDAEHDLSCTGAIMGTPYYMAPEQAEGRVRSVGVAADVYALGVILYELLTGQPPFRGQTITDTLEMVRTQDPVPPSRLQPKTPRDLETICLKCLHKEPSRRYESAAALADDLHRYREGAPILARPVGNLERAAKWARRRPAIAGLLAAVAGLLVALVCVTVLGVAGILWKYFESEDRRNKAVIAEGKAKEKTKLAKQETKRANDETKEKDRELTRAEGLVYAGNLLQAQLSWEAGDGRGAHQRLDACRWDYCGWEYASLRHQFDETQLTLRGHLKAVYSACFSSDGKRLASGSADETVKLWDAGTGQELLTLKGHTGFIGSVCFSPDGKRLASASTDGTVKLWDAVTGQELLTLKGHTGTVIRVCFSPNGKCLGLGFTRPSD